MLTIKPRMDYFAYSPFWDAKSNNNVLRTQRRIENPAYGHAEEKVYVNHWSFADSIVLDDLSQRT